MVDLVDTITGIEGIENVSMTTNGVLLPRMIDDLKAAGLSRVNISLDTLDADQFHEITRTGRLEDTLAGIDAALGAGLNPVKVNAVAVRCADGSLAVFAVNRSLERPPSSRSGCRTARSRHPSRRRRCTTTICSPRIRSTTRTV